MKTELMIKPLFKHSHAPCEDHVILKKMKKDILRDSDSEFILC